MAPRLDKPSDDPQPPADPDEFDRWAATAFPGCDPERLREATERLHALGIEGTIVHSTNDPAEMRAYLESLPACAPTS